MKKLMIMAFILLGAVVANAQTENKKERVKKTPEERAEMQVKRLTKKLELTADQQTSVKTIYLQTSQKMESIKNEKLTTDERKAQMKQLQNEKETQIKAQLTADQLAKYNEMKANMEKRRHEKMSKKKTKTE